MRTTRATVLLAVSLALLGAACGGGGDSDGTDIASLGGDATTTTDDDGSASDDDEGGNGPRRDSQEFQDAMLEYAECMRGEGIDMPDPEFDGNGGAAVIIGGPGGPGEGPPSDAEAAAFEAADEKCQPIIEEAVGEFEPPSPEEQAEMQERALEFAECMREHGVDMPDPQFDSEGRGGIAIGRDDTGRPGGIDPGDEDFQEAAEECGQDSGFGVFGSGGGGTNSSNDDSGDDE